MFSRLSNLTLITAFIIAPAIAQEAPEIRQTYAKLCAGCHGDDARGTQQGPGPGGKPSVRRRSTQSIRNVIRNGIPAAGMPGFDLPAATLDALANLVASLNARLPTQRARRPRGRQTVLLREGTVRVPATWSTAGLADRSRSFEHRARNDGGSASRGVAPARHAHRPRIRAGDVRLRDGQTLRGFARSRTSFDLALQDLKGAFHPLSLDQVSNVTEEKRSLMQPVKAEADELQNLLAFLSRLTGVQPGAPLPPKRFQATAASISQES